jgi:hypothetical protein
MVAPKAKDVVKASSQGKDASVNRENNTAIGIAAHREIMM